MSLRDAKTIVVKVGSSLVTNEGKGLDAAAIARWAEQIAALRDALAEGLRAHGFLPEPSDANWLLVEAPGLRDHLARRGIAVRGCASFGLPDHVRIAVPDDDGRSRLLEALPLMIDLTRSSTTGCEGGGDREAAP